MTTGVALITAVALTFVPSVKDSQQSARPAQTTSAVRIGTAPIQLAAAVQPLVTTTLPNLLVEWVDRIVVPPSASAPFPTPQFPPVVGGTSVSSFIKNTYNAIEPWVQWGFELVAYGVGWIPYVGWLAPQVMYFYNLGERIVRSITFNIADWIGGQVSFLDGLVNVGVDTINSFIFFANDQLAFWLPPLPPIPPIGPFAAAETAELTEPTESMATMAAEIPGEAALVEETEDPGSTDKLGDVVDSEKAIVETDVVDAAATEDEPQLIETEGAANEATLEEEPAVEDEVAEEESTTSSSGTVQAQGEVRDTGISASPDQTADNATDSSPNNDTPKVTANPTDAVSANDDSGPEKRVSSPDSGVATAPGRAAASPAQ